MKIYKGNFGFNNFNKKKMLAIFSIYIFFFVVFLSVGFSAFQESLLMQDISARVKLETDVRVANFSVSTTNNEAVALNTDYNYNRIYGDIILPQSNSSVVYAMDIVNIGNTKVGISNITGLNENFKYTLLDYKIGDPISEDGAYTLGVTQRILISIEYADGVVPSAEQQTFNFEFEFKQFYTVTYHGVPGEEVHPREIMEGTDLVIISEMTSIDRLKVTQDTAFLVYGEHFFYDLDSHMLTVKNVTGDLLLSYRDTTYLTNLSSDSAYYKNAAYKTKIKSIEFVDYVDLTNAIVDYDLSEKKDDTITAWITDNGNNTYNLYIGSIYDIYTKNFERAFASMTGLESITFKNLNTSESTSFNYTFYNTSVRSLDLSTFNTSSAIGMMDMFMGMTKLESLDVSNFDTSNVTDMWYMFGGLSNITELDISSFNTANVRKMGYMFSGMTKLKTLKLGSNFKTSRVTTMENMFAGLSSLESLDLSTFDTTSLTTTQNMFYNCSTLRSLDLSSFKVASVTDMTNMFFGMSNLESLNISNFDTSNATTMEGMFGSCSKLTSLDLSNFNTSKVTNMSRMFTSAIALKQLNLSSFDTSHVTNMSYLLSYCIALTELDLRQATFTTVTSTSDMFISVPSTVTIIVKDTEAQTWIQTKLGEGKGTITLVTDLQQ